MVHLLCAKDDLDGFVEAANLHADDKVVKSTDGVWTVTYKELENIKNDTKFTVAAVADGDPGFEKGNIVISETTLNTVLQK